MRLRIYWAFLRQFVAAWLALRKNTRKLATLIHYITSELPEESDHCLLRIILLAYLCEVESYRFYGETITGATWMRGKEGPVPEKLSEAVTWLLNRELVTLTELPSRDVRRA